MGYLQDSFLAYGVDELGYQLLEHLVYYRSGSPNWEKCSGIRYHIWMIFKLGLPPIPPIRFLITFAFMAIPMSMV